MGLLLLGIWMILLSLIWAFNVSISLTTMGVFALIVGIVLIVESVGVIPASWHPWRRA